MISYGKHQDVLARNPESINGHRNAFGIEELPAPQHPILQNVVLDKTIGGLRADTRRLLPAPNLLPYTLSHVLRYRLQSPGLAIARPGDRPAIPAAIARPGDRPAIPAAIAQPGDRPAGRSPGHPGCNRPAGRSPGRVVAAGIAKRSPGLYCGGSAGPGRAGPGLAWRAVQGGSGWVRRAGQAGWVGRAGRAAGLHKNSYNVKWGLNR